MTLHTQLLDLVQSALASVPAVAPVIHRHRTRPMPPQVAQMLTLRLVRSLGEPIYLSGPDALQWTSIVAIEYLARVPVGVETDAAVADMLSTGHQRLLSDAVLQAAGVRIEPRYQLDWDQDELDERIGAVTALYTMRHQGDLTTLSST
jgi:hypothetical protein